MKNVLSAASAVFVMSSTSAFGATLSLDETLGTFNLVTQSYTGNQEVEGRAWIGSTLSGVTGQFGFASPDDGQGFAELTVIGDIENSTINLTPDTSAIATGSLVNSTVNNGSFTENAAQVPPIDFSQYVLDSAHIATLGTADVDTSDQNNIVFGGGTVVNVDIADLSSGGYSFDFADSDFVIVNVSGTTGQFGLNALGGASDDAPQVLWNFFEATDVQINTAVEGHILAPLAHLSGFSGSTEGSVIAGSVALTNGELHQQDFLGFAPSAPSLPPAPAPVPLPAGGLLLLAGLGAFAGLRRKAA